MSCRCSKTPRSRPAADGRCLLLEGHLGACFVGVRGASTCMLATTHMLEHRLRLDSHTATAGRDHSRVSRVRLHIKYPADAPSAARLDAKVSTLVPALVLELIGLLMAAFMLNLHS